MIVHTDANARTVIYGSQVLGDVLLIMTEALFAIVKAIATTKALLQSAAVVPANASVQIL